MIRPLARKKLDGTPYTRPAAVEAGIVAVLELARDEKLRRARIRDRKDPGWLTPEVLVYLIRDALRSSDANLAVDLLEQLSRRCVGVLHRKIPDATPRADEIRHAVLEEFQELFLRDLAAAPSGATELDFFEVRFNKKFRDLLLDVKAKVLPKAEGRVPVPEVDADDANTDELDVAAALAEKTRGEMGPETRMDLQRALATLPDDLRRTLAIHFVWELDIESGDPTRETVATVLKMSGRAVRKRMNKALKLLREQLGADHG